MSAETRREGRLGNRRGLEYEQLALILLQTSKPRWCRHVRLGTAKEDREGKDIIIVTKYGDIPLQVKSTSVQLSRFRAKRRKRNAKPIAGVYCRDRLDSRICERAWEEIVKHAPLWIGRKIQ